MIKKSLIITLLSGTLLMVLCGSHLSLPAQSVNVDIPAKFRLFTGNHYVEKLYLHTDRDVYLTGETIWFKVNCLDGTCLKPSDLSKVVYVELMKDTREQTVTTEDN